MISLVIWSFTLALIPLTLGILSSAMSAPAQESTSPREADGGRWNRARRVLPRARVARVGAPYRRKPVKAVRARALRRIPA